MESEVKSRRLHMSWKAQVAGLGLVASGLAACGSPGETNPTNPPEAGTEDSAVAAVLDQVADLEGQERIDKLHELAVDEGGTLSVYGSDTETTPDMLAKFAADFPDLNLDVQDYTAASNEVTARVLQEAQADKLGADIISGHGPDFAALQDHGILASLESIPKVQDLPAEFQYRDWIVMYMSAYTVAWNTDVTDTPPASLEDLLDNEKFGKVLLDARKYNWFQGLWRYLESQGWTEDELYTFVEGFIANAEQITTSQNQALQQLESGANKILANGSISLLERDKALGATVAWEPFVSALILDPSGLGIPTTAEHPATALLFLDYVMTHSDQIEGQIPPSAFEAGGEYADVDFYLPSPEDLRADVLTQWNDAWTAAIAGQEFTVPAS